MNWTEIANLIALVALSAPATVVVAQAVKQAWMPSWLRAAVPIVVAALVGLASAWVSGDLLGLASRWGELTATEIVAVAGVVYAAANVWYHGLMARAEWMDDLGEWPQQK
jgi:hypothetical protein